MSSTTSEQPPTTHDARIVTSIDRLSLEQALRDTEVANARVIDLTARLTSANEEIVDLRARVAALGTVQAPVGMSGAFRALVAPPIKAIARGVLPPQVRARLRALLR